MIVWLSRIPSVVSFLLVVGFTDGLALAAMFAARRWANRRRLPMGPPIVSAWATVAGGLCGLLFAFAIATLWSQLRASETNLDAEATAVRLAARDVSSAQVPLLRAYVEASVREWPSLCGGGSFAASRSALVRFEREASPRSPEYAADLSAQIDALERTRFRRLRSSQPTVPDEVWVALVVLALAAIVVLSIANPERLALHVALMLVVGTELGALFWVLTVLELPFCGSTGIGLSALANALQAIGL
ncbi:MAG TPA: hypothetical protein VMW12_08145 [Candidatus Dormibacteraeota bacterium]|nr:hypothetical protein [Candidatus Dormibacteraeota bacterium]